MESEKICSKCGVMKPLDEFHKHKGNLDGHTDICKVDACARTRQWSKDNLVRKKASDKKYHSEHPATVEQRRASYLRNREKILVKDKKYRESNPERWKQIQQLSALRHPETRERKQVKDTKKKRENPNIWKNSFSRQKENLTDEKALL